MLFLLLDAWFKAGANSFAGRDDAPEDLQELRRLEKELLTMPEVTYADDDILLGLFEEVTNDRLDFINTCGPPVGLLPHQTKSTGMRMLADSAFTPRLASRTELIRKPPPLKLTLGDKILPETDSRKSLGGRFFKANPTLADLTAREQETNARSNDIKVS